MVQFSSPTDHDYRTVLSRLQILASEARDSELAASVQPKEGEIYLYISSLEWFDITTESEKEKETILVKLRASQSSEHHHKEACQRRQDGTGTWFLEGEEYRHWNTAPNSVLWIYGKCKFMLSAESCEV
jgi:hypothetical protein